MNSMNLFQIFEQNLIKGWATSSPDKIIETTVSKIFFYGSKVCKIYKYEKFFFGDFSSADFRRDFYREDFRWNKTMAPHVYLNLRGVKTAGEKYRLADPTAAEDFFIEMEKFDADKSLTNLLLRKEVSEEDLAKIVLELASRLGKLTAEKRRESEGIFKKNLLESLLAELEDDRNLLYLVPSFVAKEKTDGMVEFLKKAAAGNPYFRDFSHRKLSLLIDDHSDNIMLLDGKVEFIDVLPPKESWRVGDLNFNICRLAADAAVLWSEEKAEAIYRAYEKLAEPIPTGVKAVYEADAALIQTRCFFDLGKPSIAEKYLQFVQEKIKVIAGLTNKEQ
jgi:aminoglycoside phosphotransferase family enzyme